jgi:hypothetical protein
MSAPSPPAAPEPPLKLLGLALTRARLAAAAALGVSAPPARPSAWEGMVATLSTKASTGPYTAGAL